MKFAVLFLVAMISAGTVLAARPPKPTPTVAPNTSLRALPQGGAVQLKWDVVSGATNYAVRRRTSPRRGGRPSRPASPCCASSASAAPA